MEEFTETRKISYWENIKNSFSGIIFGLILFIASFFVLWNNEGNNVRGIETAKYLDKTVIEISAENIDRANDGKAVQVSGKATTEETLSDKIVSLPNTFTLVRKVEMYQWQENVKTESKDELGGGTTEKKTYSYEKVWSSNEIDSSEFKKSSYANPTFPIKSDRIYAETGKLGDFKLTTNQIERIGGYKEFDDLPQRSQYKIFNNMYYRSDSPENPQIGDIRISYKYVPSGVYISMIGQQRPNNTLSNIKFKDHMVFVQQDGDKTKDEMIYSYKSQNKLSTNIFRFVGWLIMYLGLNMLINPLVVIFKVIPLLESLVGMLTDGVMFLISLSLSLLTISIAWFAYRPLLSVCLLVIIAGIVFILKNKIKASK